MGGNVPGCSRRPEHLSHKPVLFAFSLCVSFFSFSSLMAVRTLCCPSGSKKDIRDALTAHVMRTLTRSGRRRGGPSFGREKTLHQKGVEYNNISPSTTPCVCAVRAPSAPDQRRREKKVFVFFFFSVSTYRWCFLFLSFPGC